MTRLGIVIGLAVGTLAIAACGDDDGGADSDLDGGDITLDTGMPDTDSGAIDGGAVTEDSGTPDVDATALVDSGLVMTDGAVTLVDGGGLPPPVETLDCAGLTVAQTITTSGFAFSPANVSLTAGSVLKFDPAGPHNMVSGSGATANGIFRSGGASEEACFRFNTVLTYPFFCEFHPDTMTGMITVTE